MITYTIIKVNKNDVLCENLESKKKRVLSKHNFYPRDLTRIKEGKSFTLHNYTVEHKKGMRNRFLVVRFIDEN